jgi:hypothetical protein
MNGCHSGLAPESFFLRVNLGNLLLKIITSFHGLKEKIIRKIKDNKTFG